MARTYRRDAKGRFASGGSARSARQGPASPAKGRAKGSAPPRRKGLVTQRRAVAAAKGKLAAMDAADQTISAANRRRGLKGSVTRARKALAAAKQAGRVKLPKMTGAISVGRPKGKKSKPIPRRLQRHPRDQAHRDKIARQTKALPKEVRRAIATAKYGKSKPGVNEYQPLTTDNPKTRLTTRDIRRELRDAGARLILGIPAFGRKKLTKAERQKEQELILQSAKSLRARMALGPVRKDTKARLPAMTVQGRIRPGRRRPPAVLTPEVMPPAGGARGGRVPASQRPGSITSTLRSTLRDLAQADAQRIREIEALTGMPVGAPKGRGKGRKLPGAGNGGTGRVSDALRGSLRELAQSDARFYRELGQIASDATPKLPGGKGKGGKRVSGGRRRRQLPGS